ncbi:MAG TPA: DNA repair protein RecN [Sporolactobacillaceae bacterium]|nr:DNA repair protein RecN [Sporolactobacillaceae bacterium]
MLLELRIENFAIIEKLNISFKQGLTVITGETGAGKSIIIDAITLLVGGRGSAEFVRYGEDSAEIEALFDVPEDPLAAEALEQIGIDTADDMLILRRTIYKNGKSVCRVNGKLVTLTHMRDIGRHLIDVHGQHEHQELMIADQHMKLLDRFGGASLQTVKSAYIKLYDEASHLQKEMSRFTKNEQELAQRLDLLSFQLSEIEEAHIEPNEEEALLEERRRFANFERLYKALQSSYTSLSGEHRGLDQLREALSELEAVVGLDPALDQLYEAFSNSFYQIEDLAYQFRDHLETLEYDPIRLDQVEERLGELNQLKRKYGRTLPDILLYHEKIKEEYHQLESHDMTIEELTKKFEHKLTELKAKAAELSKERKEVSVALENAITRELKDLYMEKAVFKVSLEKLPDDEGLGAFTRQGREKVEFLISTNPGEPLKPLVKIASGGELSRIMLAIKSHFKSFRQTTSIIFDEVDTGVSGRVAQAMAEKIYALSNASQVFCITHLPQVAAMADTHLYITKAIKEDRTSTRVDQLKEAEKIAEIARMISGAEMTSLTKQHAKELLELAGERKK